MMASGRCRGTACYRMAVSPRPADTRSRSSAGANCSVAPIRCASTSRWRTRHRRSRTLSPSLRRPNCFPSGCKCRRAVKTSSTAWRAPRVPAARPPGRRHGTPGAARVEHQVDIGYGVEESSGLLLSVEGAVALSRLEVIIRAAGGSLSTTAAGAEQRDLGEVGIQASVVPTPWLAIHGGARSRTYSTAIARQRWTTLEVGADARLHFATSPIRGVLRGGLFPVVSVTDLPRPDVALTAAAGGDDPQGAG